MRLPAFGAIGFAAVAGVAALLVALGAPSGRHTPATVSPTAELAPAAAVSEGGVTLASAAIELPDDPGEYPPGPNVALVQAHCAACHSPSMAAGQPRLSAEQWTAEVTKMREVYKAPVPAAAVPGIVAYLVAMPGQRGPAPPGRAQDPDPKAGPRISS